jgi:enoyl-CoA hydratase
MYETILVDKVDRIATITLNRPERLNAINETMRGELIAALDDLEVDKAIHVVVLKGAGRAFCSGSDVHDAGVPDSGQELHPGDTYFDWTRAQRAQRFLYKIWDLPKPVIAQVHGACMGTGALLMTMCDLVLVAEDAKIGNARIFMGAGMMGPRYVYAIGLRRAKWMDLLPGWRISGQEAVEWGWANLALPQERLEEETRALAAQLAIVPLTHLALRKVSLNRVWEQWGFKYSTQAGIDFDPLAHKSDAGMAQETNVGEQGFIRFGSQRYSTFPKRHDHA